MLKKIFVTLCLLLVIAIGVGGFFYVKIINFANQPLNPQFLMSQPKPFLVIEKGTSSQKLAQLLAERNIVAETHWLPYFLRLSPSLGKFKAGVYSLENLHTVSELLAHLNSGKEVQLNAQFIEGKTFKDWREQLRNTPYLTQTLADKSEQEIAQLLAIPHTKLEGWLAPDTYSYVPYSNDLTLLKRAYQQQQQALSQIWQQRKIDLPLASPYEMLILASIVEKETAVASERPKVASVFINRLNLKMKLQTDPTVIYGMGEHYKGNIRKKDLLEATPYNTYVIDGLPPTPIAMPSRASLEAVAQPDSTDYLYFVADGSGGHKFSRTLAEHNRAVQEWIQLERKKQRENLNK
ncbi:UPF0755 protein [Nicoletella semolina]|uniref:Endolytic murein transglycosylase n=1 Tax=Nicoletella semolina TaxID=271160 RepID=A0A4R2NB49_9PAST|nr:endolytic transglycosylase MltG [Nicoletella semolina]MDH2924810.1 aminodeoxychorismate lyase [Nicoletella semolina]TCP18343.1 UPF0755 protein [Nicoletella semolina]